MTGEREHGRSLDDLLSEKMRRSDALHQKRLLGEAAGRELIRALFAGQSQLGWLSDLFTKKQARDTKENSDV